MIVYVVNATLVSMNWRRNWFSFQRFHSLPQNFMLDCQCSEMHGLLRGLEMMCVTWHIKMWELELRFLGDSPLCLRSCVWPDTQNTQCLEYRWHLQETDFQSQISSSTVPPTFPARRLWKLYSLIPAFSECFLSTCPELLRHGRSQRRGSTHLEKLRS